MEGMNITRLGAEVLTRFSMELISFANDNWTPKQAEMMKEAILCVLQGKTTLSEIEEE